MSSLERVFDLDFHGIHRIMACYSKKIISYLGTMFMNGLKTIITAVCLKSNGK